MFENCSNSNHQGNVGLASAISWFTTQNHIVLLPLTDSQDYDLAVDMGDIKKVQVKTTKTKRDKAFTTDLRVRGGNRSGTGKTKHINTTQIDLLFILTEDGTKYLIPTKELKSKQSRLNLGPKYNKFKIV